MANIVNRANFADYPKVLEMISRCERLYDEVSERLIQDGKHGLYEDERLFINMIHRLNEQVLEGVEGEGAAAMKEPRRISSRSMPRVSSPSKESWATTSLRQLVDENDARRLTGQVSESNECNPGVDSDCDGDDHRKQAAIARDSKETRKRVVEELIASEQKRLKG